MARETVLAALGESGQQRAETRITVIATHGGMAAGRDQTINYAPPTDSEDEKST